jgi:hypothetical protein
VSLTFLRNAAPGSSAATLWPTAKAAAVSKLRGAHLDANISEIGFKFVLIPDRWRGRHFTGMLKLVAPEGKGDDRDNREPRQHGSNPEA